ncbi:hypothetical protein UFOVP75_8 [uncultured Caudovirales phage]|uniref:Uncharacterized protein n=1 Tax=uncultured Caudovirales phage TaxID=2100421 RepID=A0A6J5KZQ8_9CAUD|nr:hypothetical protein UFOVP75_8 [uncultured Caudovirales phage]
MLTAQEIAQFEARLRVARREVFSDDPAVEYRATQEIETCKAALTSMWDARAHQLQNKRADRLWSL